MYRPSSVPSISDRAFMFKSSTKTSEGLHLFQSLDLSTSRSIPSTSTLRKSIIACEDKCLGKTVRRGTLGTGRVSTMRNLAILHLDRATSSEKQFSSDELNM